MGVEMQQFKKQKVPKINDSKHFNLSGPEGSRTPVQKPIPCPSTSIVSYLTFPPLSGNRHPDSFSSFMIRPSVQSLADVVSYRVEA